MKYLVFDSLYLANFLGHFHFPRNFLGKDATEDFEDVGHSSTARAMLAEYFVGNIDASTIPSKPKFTPSKESLDNPDKGSDLLIKLLQFLVPLAILGLAVAVRFYTKST